MANAKQYHLRDCLPKLKTLWGSVNCVMYTTIKPYDNQTLIFDICGMSQNCSQMFTLVAISPYIYDIGQRSTWYISCQHLLWFIELCHVFLSNFTFVLIVAWIYGMHYYDLSIIVTFRCLWQCTHNYTNLRNIKTTSGSLKYLHFAYSCVHD